MNGPGSVPDTVSVYRSECLEQPRRLAEVFRAYASDPAIRSEIQQLKTHVRADSPVIWTGMGASFCSSVAAVCLMVRNGRPAFAVETSEWLYFHRPVWEKFAGTIMVTTSGESAELRALASETPLRPRILVCNKPGSPSWMASEIRFPILAGEERANATKTYTNSTAVTTILASELAGCEWSSLGDRVVDSLALSLARAMERRQELEEFCRQAGNIEVVGRGPSLAGAIMGALCIREMTGKRAVALSGGTFRHGPLLDVNQTHLAVIMALGSQGELGIRLAGECARAGGKVILVTEDAHTPVSAQVMAVQVEPVPEGWESLTSVVIPQVLTLAMIERTGSSYVRVQTTSE